MTPKIALSINSQKRHEMAPDLTGSVVIDRQRLETLVWTRKTKDGLKFYHSLNISRPYDRNRGCNPEDTLAKAVKLYEITKQEPTDPDYQSPQSFELLGKNYWACIWIGVDEDRLTFTLQLVDQPFGQNPDVQSLFDDLKKRTIERHQEERFFKELAGNKAEEEDDIPMTPAPAKKSSVKQPIPTSSANAEPDNVPF
jgi:hypothetical protein